MALNCAKPLDFTAVNPSEDDGGAKTAFEQEVGADYVSALFTQSESDDCVAAPALGVHPEPAPGHPPLAAGGPVVCGPQGHQQTRQEGALVARPPNQEVSGSAVGHDDFHFAVGAGGAFHLPPPVPSGPRGEPFPPDLVA